MNELRVSGVGLLIFATCMTGYSTSVALCIPQQQDGMPVTAKSPESWGKFSGNPKATLLDDGRALRLDENFIYTDPRGKTWIAPKDSVVDGASIPKVFWSLIGGPLEGRYRNASIVHDVVCDEKRETWEDVHKMFFEACMCGGLEERKAKKVYWAVYHFGPRWEVENAIKEFVKFDEGGNHRKVRVPMKTARVAPRPRSADEKDFAEAEAIMQRGNPSLEELEKALPSRKLRNSD